MANTALLIIDFQNDYFTGGKWPLVGSDEAIAQGARLLEAFRTQGLPVVHVRHEFPSDEAPFFTPDSEGSQIHPQMAPREGEPVVLKHAVNSFHETDLHAQLQGLGISKLVVVGAMSHMCIDAGVRAAADLGYEVTVAQDACATHDQVFGEQTVPAAQVHAAFMAALGFAYASVQNADEVLAALS